METKGDKKSQKIPKIPNIFSCNICDYHTSSNKDYSKHLATAKHEKREKRDKKRQTETENPKKSPEIEFCCELCNKTYSVRGSLWRHQKTCFDKNNPPIFDKELVFSLIGQNKDFQNLLREQTIAMREQNAAFLENSIKIAESNMKFTELSTKLIETPTHNTMLNVMNNSNNITNNQFNLQFFLNEQCKDAVNLIDFINSLKIQVEDLEKTGQLGYVDGISRIFVNGLRELDVYKRPIHCTDLKRETVYVKDENRWEKENPEKEKIKKAIRKIAVKNIQQLPTWQENHPEYSDVDSRENEQYMIISKHSLGGYDEEQDIKYEEKIIKNVLKGVILEKK